MKKILLNLVFLTFHIVLTSQVDRSIPNPEPAPQINFEDPISFEMKNGLKVMFIENHKLPRASVNLLIDNPPIIEGELNGVGYITGGIMGKGNGYQNKDSLNEEIDFMGARMSFSSQGGAASSLSRYFERVLTMFSQGALSPNFSKEEFNQEKNILLDNIKNDDKNTVSIARRVENVLAYGANHPYGEFITKESMERIELKDAIKFYDDYFKPNNAYLVIIGDIDIKKTKKLVKKLFGKWKNDRDLEGKFLKGSQNEIKEPVQQEEITINVIDMPNSANSEITFQNLVDLQMIDEDYYSALIANRIFGAGPESRLFNNIREDKGYAYGAYSSIGDDKYSKAKFTASTSTRSQVTDSALVEIVKEINKIHKISVSSEELKNAKAKYLGEFVLAMERPSTIANYAINIESNELQSDYYKKFLSNINKVTIEDVQKAAKKYFKLNNAQIVVTGKGSEITDNLEKVSFENKIIPIFYFDKYGNSIKKPVFNKEISSDVNVKTIFLNYVNAIGGTDVLNKIKSISTTASVKIPNAPFSPTAEIKQKHPNLTSLVMTVEGMGTLMSQKFDGENGYIEQMGQKTPFENEQINLEKEKLGLFEEVYLDPNKMEIISLNPIDGKDLYKIKVNEKSFRYYDAATNLLIIKEETVNVAGNEITSTTKYSNYKEIEGVLFPYKSEVTSGPQTVVFDITSIKLNEEIDDSFFK
jgi:predicted Zn-dependent peptidase|tara:strand:- start:239 stop:2338 length:2100 start_codon:yes stop_codon:yes gene_type:complete